MSINGLQNNALVVNTIDGLTTIYATAIYDNGTLIAPGNYVPYMGATTTVDLAGQNLINIANFSTLALSATKGTITTLSTTTLSTNTISTTTLSILSAPVATPITYVALNATGQVISYTPSFPIPSSIATSTIITSSFQFSSMNQVGTAPTNFYGAINAGIINAAFVGNLTGIADKAGQLGTSNLYSASSIYLTGASHAATSSADYQVLNNIQTLSYNVSTGMLSTPNIQLTQVPAGTIANYLGFNTLGSTVQGAGAGGTNIYSTLTCSTLQVYSTATISSISASTISVSSLTASSINGLVNINNNSTIFNTNYPTSFNLDYSPSIGYNVYVTKSTSNMQIVLSGNQTAYFGATTSVTLSGIQNPLSGYNFNGTFPSYQAPIISGSDTIIYLTYSSVLGATTYGTSATGSAIPSVAPVPYNWLVNNTNAMNLTQSYAGTSTTLTVGTSANTYSILNLLNTGTVQSPTLILNGSSGIVNVNLNNAGYVQFTPTYIANAINTLNMLTANWSIQFSNTTYYTLYPTYMLLSNGLNIIQTTSQTMIKVAGASGATASTFFNFQNQTPYATLTTGYNSLGLTCSNATLGAMVVSSINTTSAGASQISFQTLAASGSSGTPGTLTTQMTLSNAGITLNNAASTITTGTASTINFNIAGVNQASLTNLGILGVRSQEYAYITFGTSFTVGGTSGNYNFPLGIKTLFIKMIGGGGAGGGAVTTTRSTAGSTTWLNNSGVGFTCGGAQSGWAVDRWSQGGVGGSNPSLGVSGTGTCVFTAAGNRGGTGINQDGGLYYGQSGWGAGSQFTCSPTPNPSGSVIPTTGIAAPTNTGAGGSGAGGLNAVSFAASGGGSGGYAELLYQNLSFTSTTFFTYAIGAGGTPVVPTTYYGGAGGSGCIIVMGFY